MEERIIKPRDIGISEDLPTTARRDWRIGMVGFGGIARSCHAVAYRNAGWIMSAVADPDEHAREEASRHFGVANTYDDYRKLIADDSVDVIDLLTHPNIREEVLLAACEAGKHIITEKPLAMTGDECLRMIEAAENAGIKLAVHQNYRWISPNYFARRIIEKGLIGEPFLASIEIFGTQDTDIGDHPFYSTCDDFLTLQWENHMADLFRFWSGRDAKKVLAVTGRMKGQNFHSDNLLFVVADFGEDLKCHVLHHELAQGHSGTASARIDGTKGSLTFDPFQGNVTIESSLVGEGRFVLDAHGYDFVHSFTGTMGDFLRAIEEGRDPVVSGRDNLITMKTILAEAESTRRGGEWVTI